ncbi:MAG: hypothetical protein ACK4GC_04120 [Paracoccaceae bacterium]
MTQERNTHNNHPDDSAKQRDPGGSTPLAKQSDTTTTDDQRTDRSAGEAGQPSDMSYYRIQPRSGALMMLGTIGLPVAVILAVLVLVIAVF